MCLFGMSYATVSLSCTMPVFLTAVSGSFRSDGFVGGVLSYLAYALGMGIVITTVTVAIALARDSVVRRMRGVLAHLHRAAGALLVLTGLYVAYYGFWEIRVLDGHDAPEGPVAWVSDWSSRATQRIDDLGLLAVVCALVVLVGASLVRRRPGRGSGAPTSIASGADHADANVTSGALQ